MKQVLPLERPTETPKIISVAQFRPEKVGIQILWLQGTEISRLISGAFIWYWKFFVTWLFSQAHPLQLEAFSVAIGKLNADLPRPKLQFVGSCRNKSDEERLPNLKNKAVELKVDADVEFHKNIAYRSAPFSHILCHVIFYLLNDAHAGMLNLYFCQSVSLSRWTSHENICEQEDAVHMQKSSLSVFPSAYRA